jgi:hypothetical protein
VGGVRGQRQSRGIQADGHHQIETEEGEVGQVVARERFVLQVGVDEPQTPEAGFAGAQALEIGKEDRPGVPDDDGLDLPLPVDEDPDLPAGIVREFREIACQLSTWWGGILRR